MAQRLRVLERAGLVQGSWSRQDGKNVRMYNLKAKAFTVAIVEDGYQVEQAPPTQVPSDRPAVLERVPPRRPFFGRRPELAKLSNPSVRFSMVVGLPGMGKTSLALELAYRRGVRRVVWHTFTPFDSVGRFLEVSKQWLIFLDPARRTEYATAQWDIADVLDRVSDGLSRHRALIILDDYQKIRDEGIHEVVRRWQRTLVDAKVVVLSRQRPPFDLDATTQLVMLPGLDRAASADVLRECGLYPSPHELARLERAFGGHPLSLQLYAQRPGAIPGDLRPAVEDVGREAFQALDGNSQRVLVALAAVRRPFTLDGIRFLSGVKDPTVPLAILERRAMIRFEGSAYQVHDVLRESLSPVVASHPEIHRRATAFFLPSDSADDLVEALYHATKAGDWSVAGDLLERDLEGEREMLSASVNASVFLDILDEIPASKLDARHRAIFHRGHAIALLGVGKTTTVIREFQTALRIAEGFNEPRLLSLILSPLGFHLGQIGRMAAAVRVLVRNLRLVESGGTSIDKADALFMLAMLYDRQGHHGRAKEHWRLALQEARRAGNKRLILDFLTWPLAFPSDWRQMLPRLRRARVQFRRWGMTRHVGAMDFFAGEILCRAERFRTVPREPDVRKAIRLLERGITGCDTLGNRYEGLYARSWLALAFCLANEFDKAEAVAKETLEGIRKIGAGHASIFCHQALSRVCRSRDDINSAIKHLDQAVRIAHRFRCGCVGIAMLERAVLQETVGERVASSVFDEAISETIQKGFPDEVRYARELARLRHDFLSRPLRDIGGRSSQTDPFRQRKPIATRRKS